MSEIIKPGAGILFMKVGTHAQESLDDIIARKRREIDDAGFALWGYGGGTCHPLTMVQPFAKSYEKKSGAIYLCMEPMESKHFAEPKRAEQQSADGINWENIPEEISVRGSRYALVIEDLRTDNLELVLTKTKVAVGNSLGRAGSRYVRGRVDKACLEVLDASAEPDAKPEVTQIGLVARLKSPYAVFLRNRP